MLVGNIGGHVNEDFMQLPRNCAVRIWMMLQGHFYVQSNFRIVFAGIEILIATPPMPKRPLVLLLLLSVMVLPLPLPLPLVVMCLWVSAMRLGM